MVDVLHCTFRNGLRAEKKANPMLKILRSSKNGLVIFALIGRIELETLAELKRVMGLEAKDHKLVLDLKDVRLLDQSTIRFLARCEARDVTIENCPAPWLRVPT